MKKVLFIALAISMLAAPAFALIKDSAHDFSKAGAFNAGKEICVACHTPHGGDLSIAEAPLWNHDLPADLSFKMYGGATGVTVTGISALCLGCHDGATAIDSYGGTAGTEMIGTNFANADLDVDLSNDHPINIKLDDTLAGFQAPTNAKLFGTLSDQVECASCHDVHNSKGLTSLLITANAGSALCLDCHVK